MKLARKIIALAIVLCTVGAMMIPGVSAADNDLTVDFTTGIPTGSYISWGAAAASATTVEEGYPDTYNWKPYKNEAGSYILTNNGTNSNNRLDNTAGSGFQLTYRADQSYSYLTFEFKVPTTADYKLSLAACYNSNGAEAGAYILEVPSAGFASVSELPKQDSADAKALTAFDLSAIKSNATIVTSNGSERVSLDASKTYVIVFYGKGNGAAGYLRVSGFTLKYQEPVVLKADNLTVDFTSATDAPNGRYYNWGAADTATGNIATVEAGFPDTYSWKLYKNTAGSLVARNNTANGNNNLSNYVGTGGMQLNAYTSTAYIPFEFAVPGTGDYKLTVAFSKMATNGGVFTRAGAYVVEIPEAGFANVDALPKPGDEGAQALAVVTGDGSAVSSTAVKLDQTKRYVVVFFAEGTGAYIRANSFTLTYQEPIVIKTDDLTIDFGSSTDAPAGRYLNWGAADTATNNIVTVEVGYPSTYKWKLYKNTSGAVIFSNNSANGNNNLTNYATTGMQLNFSDTRTGYLVFEFEAPGTGEYDLTINTSYGTDCTVGGAYIVEIPAEGFATLADLPKEDSAEAQAVTTVEIIKQNSADVVTGVSEGTVTLDQSKRYAIVFFGKGTAQGYIRMGGFTLNYLEEIATVDGVNYKKLNAAIAAAENASDKTVTLIGDAVMHAGVNLPEGVTLDLNGKTLTTSAIYGTVKDSADGTGLIVTDKEAAVIETADGQVALWDNNEFNPGYRVFNFELTNYGVTAGDEDVEVQTFWSTLKFTNPLAYTLINTKESGLKVGFEMNWNGNIKYFEFDDATLAAWAADSAANTDATYGLYVRMSGFEALTESGELFGQAYMSTPTAFYRADGVMSYEHTV